MITGGIILVIFSFYLKSKLYIKGEMKSSEKLTKNGIKQVVKKDENELLRITQELKELKDYLENNNHKLWQELSLIKNNVNHQEREEFSFQRILQQKTREDKPKTENRADKERLPPKYFQVLSRIKEGEKPKKIARELNLGFYEIELISKFYCRTTTKN